MTTAEAEAASRANRNPVVRAITLGVCWAATGPPRSAGETEAGPRAPDGTGRDTITAANGAAGERDSGDPNI